MSLALEERLLLFPFLSSRFLPIFFRGVHLSASVNRLCCDAAGHLPSVAALTVLMLAIAAFWRRPASLAGRRGGVGGMRPGMGFTPSPTFETF